MAARLTDYLRKNVLGLVAIFIAIGGTAYAVDGPNPGQNTIGSEDIIGNEVKSDDIGNGRIFNLDIADEIITGAKLKNGTVTGSDVDESSLNLEPFFAGAQDTTSRCDDLDGTGTVCAQTAISIEKPSRLRAEHTGEWVTNFFDDNFGANEANDDEETVGRVNGSCEILIEGEVSAGSIPRRMGEAGANNFALPAFYELDNAAGSFSGQVLTPVMPAGSYDVFSTCTETNGYLFWENIVLDVFAVGT